MERNCVVCNEKLTGNRLKFCSMKCSNKFKYTNNKQKLNANSYIRQKLVGTKRKLEFVKLKGGCCSICGYSKNLSVLEFHHINEKDKNFPLGIRDLANKNLKVLLEELEKCDVLCANCHRELHNPETDMENINETILKIEQRKI